MFMSTVALWGCHTSCWEFRCCILNFICVRSSYIRWSFLFPKHHETINWSWGMQELNVFGAGIQSTLKAVSGATANLDCILSEDENLYVLIKLRVRYNYSVSPHCYLRCYNHIASAPRVNCIVAIILQLKILQKLWLECNHWDVYCKVDGVVWKGSGFRLGNFVHTSWVLEFTPTNKYLYYKNWFNENQTKRGIQKTPSAHVLGRFDLGIKQQHKCT